MRKGCFFPPGIWHKVYPVDGGMEDWSYAAGWEQSPSPISVCKPTTYGGYAEDRREVAEALAERSSALPGHFQMSPAVSSTWFTLDIRTGQSIAETASAHWFTWLHLVIICETVKLQCQVCADGSLTSKETVEDASELRKWMISRLLLTALWVIALRFGARALHRDTYRGICVCVPWLH